VPIRLNALVLADNKADQLLDGGLGCHVTDVVVALLNLHWHVRHLLLSMHAKGEVLVPVDSNQKGADRESTKQLVGSIARQRREVVGLAWHAVDECSGSDALPLLPRPPVVPNERQLLLGKGDL